ncbi:MAG: beta-ketoacyl synthase N-terminal-like domain-containing protein [Planctomycetota bacterium]
MHATEATSSVHSGIRVAITGLGLVTPLGHGAWSTYRALLAGRTIADRLSQLDDGTTAFNIARKIGGVNIARHDPVDPACALAERAAREAITQAGVEALGLPTWCGCSKGAVVALERAAVDKAGEVVALGPHQLLASALSRRTGVEVASHSVAACASSLVALDRARRAIVYGQAQNALVVSAEAALTPMFVQSYRRLGVLAPLTLAGYRGRPLDEHRSGFTLAEVGVAVVLRGVPAGRAWPMDGTKPAAELLDTACLAEAYDALRPPEDMGALREVARRLIAGRPITALHPHAPGTKEHDVTELRMLADVLNAEREMTQAHQLVSIYASKGALGHTLGSAGLVSLVLACLMRRTQTRLPMPWLEAPMRGAAVPISAGAQGISDGCHAVFAAGFGGHTAGALLR